LDTPAAASLGEFDLIAKYFSRPVRRAVLGVGDDCALLEAPAPGMHWAVSTDMLVEGRHFVAGVAPERLGHKALAVNLSDLAACGATPRAFLLSLALPCADEAFVEPFAAGLLALADRHAIELVGGDTTGGALAICITVIGEVPAGQALLRSGARAGDDLWVSGVLGDARLALEAWRGAAALAADDLAAVQRALELPQPRVALGLALRGVAHAAIDLSDGLAGDLGHVLARSRVGALLDWSALPRSSTLAAQPQPLQQQCVLGGGDDYELLFSAPTSARSGVQKAADRAAVAVSRIGTVQAEAGLRVRWPDDRVSAWAARSFDHFASEG